MKIINCQILYLLWASLSTGYHGRAQVVAEKELDMNEQAELYSAGGRLWDTEHFLKQINGVLSTGVGYADGRGLNLSYEEACTDQTGFIEAIRVVYDPQVSPIPLFLMLYFETINPTPLNRQGGNVNTQYCIGIYCIDAHDLSTTQTEMARLSEEYSEKVQIEVQPLRNFYATEDYYQDYLDKNPGRYYHVPQALMQCAHVINKDIAEFPHYMKKTDAELKQQLTFLQYEVTQHTVTKHLYDNECNGRSRPGIYIDATTGEPLFLSTDKFESGCGWPVFSKPIDPHLLEKK